MLLQTVTVQGGEAQILDAGEPFYWSWAPNSQRLLIHASDASAGDRLSFLHLGERVVEEGLSVQPTAFHAPAWSPDGQQLLLAAEVEEGQNALIVTDSQGTEPQELDQLPDGLAAFGWSPDSKKVAYIASATAQTQSLLGPMTVIDLEEPDKPITTEEELVLAFFWAPNNRQIAYFVPLAAPAEEGQPEGEGGGQVFLLGLYILDVENGESERIAVFRPTQEFVSVLPFFDQYHQSITIWSPDSNNLVVPAFAGSEIPSVWVVAASGQLDPRPLTEGVLAFWSWK
jgi:Tol biopolymer transport system component